MSDEMMQSLTLGAVCFGAATLSLQWHYVQRAGYRLGMRVAARFLPPEPSWILTPLLPSSRHPAGSGYMTVVTPPLPGYNGGSVITTVHGPVWRPGRVISCADRTWCPPHVFVLESPACTLCGTPR